MTLRKNNVLQEREIITYDHAQLTADATVILFKVPSGKKLRIEKATYINPTGLVAHAANFFNIKIIKATSTLIANWSTETGEEGTIAADTFVDLVLGATDADQVVVGGAASGADLVKVLFDEDGTATLPAGRIVIEGRYVH